MQERRKNTNSCGLVVGYLPVWMATTPGLEHAAITTLSTVPALVARFQSQLRVRQHIGSTSGVDNLYMRRLSFSNTVAPTACLLKCSNKKIKTYISEDNYEYKT